jgi:hypothetical protein
MHDELNLGQLGNMNKHSALTFKTPICNCLNINTNRGGTFKFHTTKLNAEGGCQYCDHAPMYFNNHEFEIGDGVYGMDDVVTRDVKNEDWNRRH